MTRKKLTAKQRGFKRDVIKTKNPTEAAARNYNVKNRHVAEQIAYENMRKPEIALAIEEEFKKEDLTVEWVLKGLKKHAEVAKETSASIRAFELVGKHLKMFTEVTETKDTTDDKAYTKEECDEQIDKLLDRRGNLGADKPTSTL